jgi:subtilisin
VRRFVHSHCALLSCFLASIIIGGGVLTASVAEKANATPAATSLGIADHYIIVFKDFVDHPGSVAHAQTDQRNGELGFVYRSALKGYSAALSEVAVKAIANDPRVAYIERDAPGGIAAQTTPTGIKRTFATANKALAINEQDDLQADVDVAVFDTGIDYKHTDLNVVARTDCSNGAKKHSECVDESGTDEHSHGTHVAGIVAAIDDGDGVTGIAPGARLWAIKVLDKNGSGELSEFIAGIDWVTTRADKIEVANASLRYLTTSSQAFSDAIKASIEAGVVQVVAAGNEEEAVKYIPGNYGDAITVSAVADFDGQAGSKAGSSYCRETYELEWPGQTDDSLAEFSNYGNAVDIAAPGVCILSTVPGSGYAEIFEWPVTWSGTSMAAPHVAGAAAILAGQTNPSSKKDVEGIRETLVKAGNKGWTDTSGDGTQEPLLDLSSEGTFQIAQIYELRNTNSAGSPDYTFTYGSLNDRPAAADWNGDGSDSIGYYRPSTGAFYLRNSNSIGPPDSTFTFGGGSGDLPIAGDWNNDGTDTIGVYRPSEGTFYLRNSNTTGTADITAVYGTTGDMPIIGDWNNDGTDTIGVYRPSEGTFYLRNTNSTGTANITFSYGAADDLPIAGDWNNDGTATIGVYED